MKSKTKLFLIFSLILLCLAESSAGTVIFNDDFSSDKGWAYGVEWERGTAAASSNHNYGGADPTNDHSPTSDNMTAGAVIGKNVTTAMHGYYYLTSPVIPCLNFSNVTLSLWRWLNSDYIPYMTNTIQVYDGSSWKTIWITGVSPGIQDSGWTNMAFNITAYAADNPDFQIRFGHGVGSAGAQIVSGWNIDDLTVTVMGPSVPNITIIDPDEEADLATTNFLITWTDRDADNDAVISLYYDTTNNGTNGTLIISGLSEDSAVDSYNWDVSAMPHGNYYIYAVIDDGAIRTHDYSRNIVSIFYQDLSLPFIYSADGLTNAVTHYPLSGPANDNWNLSSARTRSGVSSWHCGRPAGYGDSALEISIFTNLPSDAYLSFYHYYEFGGFLPYNGGIVEITTNNRNTWFQLFPEKGVDGKRYDDTLYSHPLSPEFHKNPLRDLPAYTYSSMPWDFERFDLSAYAGKDIGIRFHVGWSISYMDIWEGWYIDDIIIKQQDPNDPYISLLTPETNVVNIIGKNFTIEWIDNDADDDARIHLFYYNDQNSWDTIVYTISEDSTVDSYNWDMSPLPDGVYYVYALITDDNGSYFSYSPGYVRKIKTGTLPFFEDFPNVIFNSNNWSTDPEMSYNYKISAKSMNEPSPPFSLCLDGEGDRLTSVVFDTSPYDKLYISFYYQRGGEGEPPDQDDSLQLYYYNGTQWTQIWSTNGNGLNETNFNYVEIEFPPDALYSNFAVRWVSSGSGHGFDYFFIDNISIATSLSPQPLPPSDTTPPDTTASKESGMYTGDTVVVLTAVDDISGIDKIYYTTDGTDPKTSSTALEWPSPVLIKINKPTTLKFYATDKAGNAEEVQSKYYNVLKMPDEVEVYNNYLDLSTHKPARIVFGKSGRIKINIYNFKGVLVKDYPEKDYTRGEVIEWYGNYMDTNNKLASGIYIVVITGDLNKKIKMIIK